MGRLFGTDGIRGLAGSELTAELARGVGAAAVSVLHDGGRPTFVVARDPRASGEWLEDALVEGIRLTGGDVVLAGVEPTPAVAFMTVDLGASAGVVISASHNPPAYNGIKFFGPDGTKLSDELEDRIEAALDDPPAEASVHGAVLPAGEARARYVDHLVAAAEASLEGMTIVVDCANGAASTVAPALYERLGAKVHAIHATPDGDNINEGCGALHPEVVAAEVVRLGADAGVSHDGDADRALFADASGAVIDGDQVLAACALDLHGTGRLPGDLVVTTVMANLGFSLAMREAGIEVRATQVGDRYVLEEMTRSGAAIGGEQSGHLIFREHATTGDGLLTAVRFLSLAARRRTSVGELAAAMRRYPQVLVNVRVDDRDVLAEAADVAVAVADAERELGDRGRVLVRPSGTEPLVRVMVEAQSEQLARAHADRIAEVVRSLAVDRSS
jgi:phosphoglucosamine mutase